MAAQFYWGGPEMTGKGQRAQRQLGAMTNLAGSIGQGLGMYRGYQRTDDMLEAQEHELNTRLGRQELEAVADAEADSSPPNTGEFTETDLSTGQTLTLRDIEEGDDGGGTPGTNGPSGGGGSGILGNLSRLATKTLAPFGLMYDPERKEQLMRLAERRGELGRDEDHRRRLAAAGSYISVADEPGPIAEWAYPGIPNVARREPDRAMSEEELVWQAAGGDDQASRAVDLLRGLKRSGSRYGDPNEKDYYEDEVIEDKYGNTYADPIDAMRAARKARMKGDELGIRKRKIRRYGGGPPITVRPDDPEMGGGEAPPSAEGEIDPELETGGPHGSPVGEYGGAAAGFVFDAGPKGTLGYTPRPGDPEDLPGLLSEFAMGQEGQRLPSATAGTQGVQPRPRSSRQRDVHGIRLYD